ncbi:hypothetical protein ACFL3D_06860, partial [Candidatus Omnitrophota bacterium]
MQNQLLPSRPRKLKGIAVMTTILYMVTSFIIPQTSFAFNASAEVSVHTLANLQNGNADRSDLTGEVMDHTQFTRDAKDQEYVRKHTDRSKFGISYNGWMTSKEIEEKIQGYTDEGKIYPFRTDSSFGDDVKDARDRVARFFTDKDFTQGGEDYYAISIIETNTVTFGATVIDEDGIKKILIEKPLFFDALTDQNAKDTHKLARLIVFALNGGTHEENRVAEFEFARTVIPEQVANLPFDVERIYDTLVTQELPDENDEHYDAKMAELIKKQIKQSLWEIGINFLNNETNGIVLCPIKADPLHYGHIDSMLRAMAQHKLAGIGIHLQGFDYRKPNNGGEVTFPARRHQVDWLSEMTGGELNNDTGVVEG